MIGMMIGRAVLKGAAGATSKGATPPKEVRPTPCHPAAVAAVLVGLAVIILGSVVNGGQVVWWITPVAFILGFLILGGMFMSGVSEAKAKRVRIKEIPGNPNAAPSAADLNAYYATLRAPEKAKPDPLVAGIVPLSEVKARTYKSLNMILAEEEALIRRKRVTDILQAECPTCTTHEGGFCTFHPGQSVVRLDHDVIVHSTRVSYAIKTGAAKLADVKAQFGGTIPVDIMAGAL